MSKRIEKKKQKRQNDAATANNTPITASTSTATSIVTSAAAQSVKEQIDFFIQYQDQEYLEKDILQKIKEKCKSEGIEITANEKLSVYLKPEEQKAYYTYPGNNGFVEV